MEKEKLTFPNPPSAILPPPPLTNGARSHYYHPFDRPPPLHTVVFRSVMETCPAVCPSEREFIKLLLECVLFFFVAAALFCIQPIKLWYGWKQKCESDADGSGELWRSEFHSIFATLLSKWRYGRNMYNAISIHNKVAVAKQVIGWFGGLILSWAKQISISTAVVSITKMKRKRIVVLECGFVW